MLTLRGATLLHVAAEYQNLEAAKLLLSRGADVNSRATLDAEGVGGQTALFHSATQNDDAGLPIARLLVEHGADLSVRAKVPGHYEHPGETLECTAPGYAIRFEKTKTAAYLRSLGATG
jgi:ankyrin repeat protein